MRKRTTRKVFLAVLLSGAALIQHGVETRLEAQTPAASGAGTEAQRATDLSGSWQGTITPPNGGNGARVLIEVSREGAGGAPYKGTLYLVDAENGRAVGAPAIAVRGADVSFALPLLGNGMAYSGTLTADGKTISGGLKPANRPVIQLNLTHVAEEDAWPVPQPAELMAKDAHPKFEVVTVKPHPPRGRGDLGFKGHEFVQMGFTVDEMIGLAYAMHADQILGAPGWFRTDKWDIVGVPDTPGRPTSPQSEDLTHDVLATRFGMKFHHEQRELTASVITLAKGGPKLQPTASGPDDSPRTDLGYGDAVLQNMTIANFAKWFETYVLDRPVIDKTGLTGFYDFTLKWTPDESQYLQTRGAGAPPPPPEDGNSAPALNDAMLQQLGLKIERVKTMADVMVIDHAEKPSAN